MSGFVIIGAGKAGAAAAALLAGAGERVTLLGAEAHPPYDRPPLSKSVLLAGETPPPEALLTPAQLAAITFRPAVSVTRIERAGKRLYLTDGTWLPYAKLLLATGAAPRRLDGDGVAYLRTYEDALALRARLLPGRRVVLVGGGVIGLELAAAARQRGAEVTIIEAGPRLLTRGVPRAVAAEVAARHEAAGITLRTGAAISQVSPGALELAGGEVILADLVVAGIGAVPRTQLAEAAGLAVGNGIITDETLRTADPDIYAAGDCCAFPHPLAPGRLVRLESWRNAQDQGEAAARAMLGAPAPFRTAPWFWSDQFDRCLYVAGWAEPDAQTIARPLAGGATLHFQCAPDATLLSAAAFGPVELGRDIRLAEMLINSHARPMAAQLADPSVPLKSLLRR